MRMVLILSEVFPLFNFFSISCAANPILDVAMIGAGPHSLSPPIGSKNGFPLWQPFQALDPLPWVGGLPGVDRGYSGEN